MTNPKRGEFRLSLGDQTYQAKVTMDGLARIETSCNAGIIKILNKLTEGELTTTDVCNVLYPIIRGGGNDVTFKDVQKIVWDAGLAEAMKGCGEVLAAALGAGQDEGNEPAAAE